MANRVNINITARDLTRGELARLRRNFGNLGNDINQAVGARTRQNFDRLRQSVNQSRRDLRALRGAIPDDEFIRMDNALQRAQRRMQRGFGRVGQNAFARIIADLRDVEGSFRRLDESAQIRVRTDLSALRRADAQLNAWRRRQSANAVRVRVDPDTRGFGRRLTRTITAPFRQTGRVIGGILSDGIGQGIVAGFQGAGPVGIAIFAGIIAGAVTLLGAALGGILVFAFGAAAVGIAGFMASKSKDVQKAWKKTVDSIKEDFKGVGKPMEEVILKGLGLLRDMSDQFAPHFKKAIEDAAPHLLIFQQKLAAGIEKFGEIAFKPMMDAFNELLDSLGPEMETFFTHLGESFAYLADAVSENSDEVALAIRYVLELVTGLVYVLGFLVNRWGEVVRLNQAAAASFELLWVWIERNWDVAINVTRPGMEMAIERTAALWGWVKRGWDVVVAVTRPGMEMAIERAQTLWGLVKRNWATVVKFTSPGLQTAINAVKTLWGWVNRNWFRSVTLSVSVPGLSAAKAGLKALGFAHGGVVGTAATGGVRGNMTLVGEQGPELVDLPPGSRVRPNGDSRRLMGEGKGGNVSQFIFKSSGRRADDLLLEILREAIHQRGGDPVAVLGG